MPEFYDVMFIIVRRMAAVKKRPGGYELLTDKGGRLGELEAGVRNPVTRLLQAMIPGPQYPRRIQVKDSQGRMVCELRKQAGYGRLMAAIADGGGQPVGKVREVKREMGLSGQRFEVVDAAGKLLGSFVGDWRAWNLQIFDDKDGLLGKITKRSENVNRVIYADVDHYAVELIKPIPGESRKRVLLSVAASLEPLMA